MKLKILFIEHVDWTTYDLPEKAYDDLIDNLYSEEGARWWPMVNVESGLDEVVNLDMAMRIEINFIEIMVGDE